MLDERSRAAAQAIVDRLRAAYNGHDVDAIVSLFGRLGVIRDQAWGEMHESADAIGAHYRSLFTAAPDLRIEERNRYITPNAIVTESIVSGTHQGPWRGLPPTGNAFDVDVWSVLNIDDTGARIREVRYAYDRARLLEHLGLLHDLDSGLGRAVTALSHPMTMARAAARRISSRPPPPQV